MVWEGCIPKGPYVGIFGLQIVVLFWKTLEHLGSGVFLEEIIDGGGSSSPYPLPVLSGFLFFC